jgi:hypothetical protein
MDGVKNAGGGTIRDIFVGTDETGAVPCPVRFLGHRAGLYYLVSPSGEKRVGSARDLGYNGILSVFDGKVDWLEAKFPGEKGGFDAGDALAFMIRECVEAGVWDDNAPTHGLGTWDSSEGIAVHCGDMVWHKGQWHPAGLEIDNILYPTAPRIARPDFTAVPTAAQIRKLLLDNLYRWNYVGPLGPEMVIGWIGAALLGGAPSWRDHVVVMGPRGCGKSHLTKLVHAALGGQADRIQRDTSVAGTKQSLNGEARTIFIDEAENESGEQGPVVKMITMIRQLSDGDGVTARRGSPSGKASETRVTGCAWLAAILPPMLKPQDRSRFIQLNLKPLVATANVEETDAAIAAVGAMAPGLWARMALNFDRFRATFAAYHRDLIAAKCDIRQADLIATWAAGRDVLIEDGPLEAAEWQAEIDRLLPYARRIVMAEADSGEGEECWRFLLSSPVDVWGAGARRTVGSLLLAAMRDADARKAITQIGIRWATLRDPELGEEANAVRVIAVANQHARLTALFDGTRWADGSWVTALRMLDGTFVPVNAIKFNGPQSRVTAIPPIYLEPDDDDDEQPSADPNDRHQGQGIPDLDHE